VEGIGEDRGAAGLARYRLIIIGRLFEDLDRLTDDVLQLARQAPALDSVALTFLLRQYRATDRADLRATLETALGAALERPLLAGTTPERAGHLTALVEALPVADDGRVRAAVVALVDSLRAEWGAARSVDESAVSLDACLIASGALDDGDLVPGAIDEMERVIAGAYRPGEGLAHELAAGSPRGFLADHVGCASALLAACVVTARVPYAMLAEELMQFARRTLWDESAGAFVAAAGARDHPFPLNCAAVGVFCRLASLHGADDYRAAAVVVPGVDYRRDAARILESQSVQLDHEGLARAHYGLALADWLGGS
jgi:hypothetical protein